jgi:hypothetical protein
MTSLAFLLALFAMAIPIVAIVGGITAGIMKSQSRQKLLEMAQRERLVALERGIDPDKLPPLQLPEELRAKNGPTFEQRSLRRSNLLMIWGLVVAGFGLAMMIAMLLEGEPSWGMAFIFVFVGLALMLGSRVGRPTPEEVQRSLERRRQPGSSTPERR